MKHNAKSFSNLLGEMVTTEDIDTLREELEAILNTTLTGEVLSWDEQLKVQVRPRVLASIDRDLKEFDGDRREYAQEALAVAGELPVMEITLAYEPVPAGIRRIVEKLRELSGQLYIVSILVNPAILGGMVGVVRGEFRDYSLSNKLGLLMSEMYPGIE